MLVLSWCVFLHPSRMSLLARGLCLLRASSWRRVPPPLLPFSLQLRPDGEEDPAPEQSWVDPQGPWICWGEVPLLSGGHTTAGGFTVRCDRFMPGFPTLTVGSSKNWRPALGILTKAFSDGWETFALERADPATRGPTPSRWKVNRSQEVVTCTLTNGDSLNLSVGLDYVKGSGRNSKTHYMEGSLAISVESTSEAALDATYKFLRSAPGRLLWTGRVGGSAVPQGRWKAVKQRLEFEEGFLGRRDKRGLEVEDGLLDSDLRDIQLPSGGNSNGPARAAAVSSKVPGVAGGSTQLPRRAPAPPAPKPVGGSPKAPGPGGANRLRSGVSYAGAVKGVASPEPAAAGGKSSGADLARSALLAVTPAPGSGPASPPITGETFRGSQANVLELLLPGMRPFLEAYARAHPQQRQVAAEVLASAPGIIAAKYGAGAVPQPPPPAKGAAADPAVGAVPPKASPKAKGTGKAASSGSAPKGGGKGSAKAVASPKPAAPPKPAAAAPADGAVAPAAGAAVVTRGARRSRLTGPHRRRSRLGATSPPVGARGG